MLVHTCHGYDMQKHVDAISKSILSQNAEPSLHAS